MSVSCCYWAMLGLDDFNYIYLSDHLSSFMLLCGKTPYELLIYQSLFHFIHPDEQETAKSDLLNFIEIKSLAGAVTRCRLKNTNRLQTEEPWIVTDIIMYTATSNTILAFFHSHVNENYSINDIPCCGNGNIYSFKASLIQHILNSNIHPMHWKKPFRIFQIHDTNTHELVLSWTPTFNIAQQEQQSDSIQSHPDFIKDNFIKLTLDFVHTTTIQMIQEKKRVSDYKVVCTHHSHSNSTVLIDSFGTCEIERIVITYGSLTFSIFQVTPPLLLENNIKSNSIAPLSSTTIDTSNLVVSPITMDIPKSWKSRFGTYEKKCEKCHTNSSPEWRKGPSGHKTLCNACGLRYARSITKQHNSE